MKITIPKILAMVAGSFMLLGGFTGCETLGKLWTASTTSVSEKTTTTLIVDAEKAINIASDAQNTFLKLEKAHRTAYAAISPEIHNFSVWLRVRVPDPNQVILPGEQPPIQYVPRGIGILETAQNAKKAFKANRTSTNEANLSTALAAVQSIIDGCNKFTTLATTGQ